MAMLPRLKLRTFYYLVIEAAIMLACRGRVQREDHVIHMVVEQLENPTDLPQRREPTTAVPGPAGSR